MKVNIGTLEITDAQRKAIRKSLGHRGGVATRDDVKKYLGDAIDAALDSAGTPPQVSQGGGPPEAEALPEPTAGGPATSGGTTTGATGGGYLGSDGTPGGTV
jgi:hypothetical protein